MNPPRHIAIQSALRAATAAPWLPLALVSSFSPLTLQAGDAQSQPDLLGESHLYPVIRHPEPDRYNLKWHNLTARFQASVTAEVTDNIGLSDQNPEADFGIGPSIEAGFLLPLNSANSLQLDFGIGYQWYVDHPSIQSITVSPNSRLEYYAYLDNARLSLHNNFGVQVDPTSRADLSGDTASENVSNFRRIINQTGLTGEWLPSAELKLTAGYDFGLDRSISGEFSSIDRDSHSVGASASYEISPALALGLGGSYSLSYYMENIQNDAHGFSAGPILTFKPSQFITINAAAGYSVTTFDSNGTIDDNSDFRGVTGQIGVRHTLNSRISHEIRARRSLELGLGSNFYDLTAAEYAIRTRIHSAITLHGTLAYEHYRTSGALDENGDRYGAYLGAHWQPTRQWSFNAGYTFNIKASNLPGNDYLQNRVSIQLTRLF